MVELLRFEYFVSSVPWFIAKATTLALPALALDLWSHIAFAASQDTGISSILHSHAGSVEHVCR